MDKILNEKKMGFLNKYNVNGVIGAIDGTHISIIAPPEEDLNFPGRVYYNRKGYTSINTQIICDSDLNILSINARYPGSSHDAAIWSTSGIRRHLLNKYVNGLLQNTFLIDDSGYPLEPWPMTPVDGAQEGTPEFIYNEIHITTRNPIERLNGVLKSRFLSLLRHRTLNYHPVQAGIIINACAVHHNIAQYYNVDMPDEDILDNPTETDNGGDERPHNNRIMHQLQWYAEGVRVRNNLIQHII